METAQMHTCWEPGVWGPRPHWPEDPDISAIESLSRKHLKVSAEDNLSVTFHAEGAFNKVYILTTSDSGGLESHPPCIFRVTLPVEPFYKTASEVATLSYLREHTSVPVPRVFAYDPTADNELGYEWILMEKVPGVPLRSVWRDMDMESKRRETRIVAQYAKQLHDQCSFSGIGNLYFRNDVPAKPTVPTADQRFVIGPIVTTFMFAGGRKLRLPRNLGPYLDDAAYMAALADAEAADMEYIQTTEAQTYEDFDEDIAEEAEEILEALQELREISTTLFPSSRPFFKRSFVLDHHDLSLSNILVDPNTYRVTGIIDWECTGARTDWEDRYPRFLTGREINEEPEPLSPGDDDPFRVERWEDWEKTILRPLWDQELGNVVHDDDGADKMKLEWRVHLDWLEVSVGNVFNWITGEYMEWSSRHGSSDSEAHTIEYTSSEEVYE